MNDPKRQEIKNRIATSQARNEARKPSADAQDGPAQNAILGFVKDHPLATIAGGIAVGVLVAGMFPSARKAAKTGGARASTFSVLGSQAALAAIQHLLASVEKAGQAGTEQFDDLGSKIGDAARSLRHDARHLAERSGDTARDTSETLTRSLKKWWK